MPARAVDPVIEWISAEVMPHEGHVRAWLHRATPPGLEPADVIQESYSRIARLTDVSAIQSGRAYFFTVARNIVREHLRREVSSISSHIFPRDLHRIEKLEIL